MARYDVLLNLKVAMMFTQTDLRLCRGIENVRITIRRQFGATELSYAIYPMPSFVHLFRSNLGP